MGGITGDDGGGNQIFDMGRDVTAVTRQEMRFKKSRTITGNPAHSVALRNMETTPNITVSIVARYRILFKKRQQFGFRKGA